MGHWSYVTDSTGSPMHVSTTAGDRVQTMFAGEHAIKYIPSPLYSKFAGSAITVYGLVSSFSGRYSVIIDNVTTTISAQSSYNNSDALLFFATGLSQDNPHQLTIVNEDNRTFALRAGGVNVTAFGNITMYASDSSFRTQPTLTHTTARQPARRIASRLGQ